MKITSLIMAASAAAMVTLPVAANAAAVQNPAAKLSVASNVRSGKSAGKSEKLLGGAPIVAALIVAGIAAIGIVAIVNNDNNNNNNGTPASN